MHEARINNTIIHYPSEWDELTRKQLELIVGLSTSNISEMTFKTHLLFHLANIKIEKTDSVRNPDDFSEKLFRVKLKFSDSIFISSSQILDLANGFDFIFKKNDTEKEKASAHLDSHLTKNLIPSFKVGATIYYGPSDKLFNITFSEFIHAETNLKRFGKTREVKHLDKLIAILYRPQDYKYDPESVDFNGDRRTPFNDHRIDDRAEKISKLNHNVKLCIFLFYQGCQWWIKNQFPHVFSHKSSGNDEGLGFLGLVDALTSGDVTKTEEVRLAYLMDVMVHLERAALENEKAKENIKKH